MAVETEASEDLAEDALAALVYRTRDGDEAAFETLYFQTVDRVFGLVRRVLVTPADAEEVTEDVYLYVWKHASRFDHHKGSVLAWLYTLAHSRAIDRLRSLRRQARTGEAMVGETSAVALPEEDVLASLAGERLHALIAGLPEVQRQVLALAYFRGLSQREIADALTLSLGTVKTHLRRTLIALREMVAS